MGAKQKGLAKGCEQTQTNAGKYNLVDVSDIFFFLLGGGQGGVRGDREGGGCRFFKLKIPGWGVSPRKGGGEGVGRLSAGNFFGGGGWQNVFCFVAEFPTKKTCYSYKSLEGLIIGNMTILNNA